MTSVVARFGETVIAASATIDRLVPVAFGGLFALSGAIGPILGQNWGAGASTACAAPCATASSSPRAMSAPWLLLVGVRHRS